MPWGEPDRPQALNRMLIRLPGCFDVREQGGNLSLIPKRFVRDPVLWSLFNQAERRNIPSRSLNRLIPGQWLWNLTLFVSISLSSQQKRAALKRL